MCITGLVYTHIYIYIMDNSGRTAAIGAQLVDKLPVGGASVAQSAQWLMRDSKSAVTSAVKSHKYIITSEQHAPSFTVV